MNNEISVIRRRFDEGDIQVANMLPGAIRESWLRCANQSINMSSKLEYSHVRPDILAQLKNKNEELLTVSNRHIEQLYRAVAGAGWSVLLTDTQCNALQVRQANRLNNSRIASAFRDGVVLNETNVGTTAMSCALNNKQFTRVFGAEHYKEQHNAFHCAAAPVFDHMGRLCASLDITNEHALNDIAVFYMLETCARNIQKSLILNLRDTFVIEIIPSSGQFGDITNLLFGISPDGKMNGCNEAASTFLSHQSRFDDIWFDNLFSSDISMVKAKRAATGDPFYLTLHSGVTLASRVIRTPNDDASLISNVPKSKPVTETKPTPDTCFGDSQLEMSVQRGAKVLNRLPVMLHGESGVGKEVTAKHLHNASQCTGKFVSINCASIPESLIESELFGYQAGAFTGADKKGFKGRIAEADKGTLFLDEIGDMPLALQSRLLRVLETREVSPLGSATERKIDFQLICATNVNLEQAVEQGRFRQDLYFRLKGFAIPIKPLRERENKLAIADTILAKDCQAKTTLSAEVKQFIECYTWPGNIRELRNALLYADAIGDENDTVELTELPDEYQTCQQCISHTSSANSTAEKNSGRLLDQASQNLINQVVEDCSGNISLAAKKLGISRATLYRKMAKERSLSALN